MYILAQLFKEDISFALKKGPERISGEELTLGTNLVRLDFAIKSELARPYIYLNAAFLYEMNTF